MTTRGQWRAAALAGVVMVAGCVGFNLIEGLRACTPPPGIDPIIGFELARSPAQVAAMLADLACREAQALAVWPDAFLFIPAYAALLGFAALAAGGRFAKIALGAVIGAALLDQIEGVTLARILNAFPGEPSHFEVLVPVVRTKFALLGAATLLIGGRIAQPRGWNIAPGAVIAFGGGVTVVSVSDDARAAAMVGGALVGWLVLLGYAAIRSFMRAGPA